MVIFLLVLQAVFVLGVVLFTISFLIASLNEKEQRAALIAGAVILLLIGFELCIYWIYTLGFFLNSAGLLLLLAGWVVIGYGIYFFCRHTGPNKKALKGVEGLIVGKAQRFDEREQVFARERGLRRVRRNMNRFIARIPNWSNWIQKEERPAAFWVHPVPSIVRESYPTFRRWKRPMPFRPILENPKTTARRFS